jgi:hypothetical protein
MSNKGEVVHSVMFGTPFALRQRADFPGIPFLYNSIMHT